MTKKHTHPHEKPSSAEAPDGQEKKDVVEEMSPAVEELKKVEKTEAEEYLEGWKRTQAEFENYKKRQAASQKELGGYLIEKLLLDIIPVLDNFHQATQHVPEDQKNNSWVVGIQYIEKQLEDVLKANGVDMVEAKEGDLFDPKIHEAVNHEPSSAEATDGQGESEEEKHVVSKMLQKGFKIGERIIRPAKVTTK